MAYIYSWIITEYENHIYHTFRLYNNNEIEKSIQKKRLARQVMSHGFY